jgi:protein tyrosine phosphatase
MQYLSWPDHGTPEDPAEFVEFVDEVREMRDKASPLAPTIVHCSAGIGKLSLRFNQGCGSGLI